MAEDTAPVPPHVVCLYLSLFFSLLPSSTIFLIKRKAGLLWINLGLIKQNKEVYFIEVLLNLEADFIESQINLG